MLFMADTTDSLDEKHLFGWGARGHIEQMIMREEKHNDRKK